jgi:acyl-coenzyme A synthetase/AMP-(fatty) acid ligase
MLDDLRLAVERAPEKYDLSSVEVIVYGWNALSPALAETLTRICGGRVQLVGIFGQTEAIACHRFWPNRWPDIHRRTAPQQNYVGVPTPLLGAAVMGEDGELIDAGISWTIEPSVREQLHNYMKRLKLSVAGC